MFNLKGARLNQECLAIREKYEERDNDGQIEKIPLCKYHDNLIKNEHQLIKKYQHKLLDIEDLYQEGKKEEFCPFYLERKKKV